MFTHTRGKMFLGLLPASRVAESFDSDSRAWLHRHRQLAFVAVGGVYEEDETHNLYDKTGRNAYSLSIFLNVFLLLGIHLVFTFEA
jgi:hypothetical protein